MIVFSPVAFVVLACAQREEVVLARRHAESWGSYAKRVSGWVPWFW